MGFMECYSNKKFLYFVDSALGAGSKHIDKPCNMMLLRQCIFGRDTKEQHWQLWQIR